MLLTPTQVNGAIQYNRTRGYSRDLVQRIQKLVGTTEDGIPGRQTALAVAAWQQEFELTVDGKVGPTTLDEMHAEWWADQRSFDDSGGDDGEVAEDDLPAGFVDLRSVPRTRRRGKPRGSRPWHEITGITLHQTAVDFGSPTHARVIDVPAHALTFQGGEVALLNPPTALMYHGNGFNRTDVGIEVSCRAAGIEGVFTRRRGDPGPNTFWRSAARPDILPLEASDEQLETTRELVRYYVELVAKHGGEVRFIHAHRQSAAKPSDPGSRIWKAVGRWGEEELGLSSGPPGYHIGNGLPLPTAWDPRIADTPYSWRVRGY